MRTAGHALFVVVVIVSSQANIKNSFFDQKSSQHQEGFFWAYAQRGGGQCKFFFEKSLLNFFRKVV